MGPKLKVHRVLIPTLCALWFVNEALSLLDLRVPKPDKQSSQSMPLVPVGGFHVY